ncbi:MAG TPA: hypothetical protein VHP37_27600 [Burkholderiales bacterium]|nr:hypothetical protein [Burkholderiales bacterium]
MAEQRAIQPPRAIKAPTHTLGIYAYSFAGTRWRNDEIAAALPKTAELLAQCAIALDRVDLYALDAVPRYRYFYTPVSRELVRAIDAKKPAVFFVEDTRNNPAFDAEAIGLANANRRPELANTVWIAYGTRDLAHAIAHEIVHVLSDSGAHSSEAGNLMRDETSPANATLTAEQCRLARTRGEANGLLTRIKQE